LVMAVNGWDFVLLFAYISAALLLAAFLRKQFLFMQRLMIPNAIVAGLIVLLCSRLFGIMKISPDQLEITVYHLLTGIFILIGLKEPRVGKGRAIFTTTMIISQGYALLALIGCIFTSIWVGALFPKFFPSFSMLPMLGFGFDHLTAWSMGLQWEQAGFTGGGYAGFSFGVMGLIWAYLGGVSLVLWSRKRQREKEAFPGIEARQGIIPRESEKQAGSFITTAPEAVESLALHLALVGLLYLLVFFFMSQISSWLGGFGESGKLVGGLLWSYNFIFGLLLGRLGRIIIDWLGAGYLFDSGTMKRISGAMVDYMITAAIAAVPLFIYEDYWPEVVILSLISGAAMAIFLHFASRRMYTGHHLARNAAVFGFLTGTIASGLALLRMVDPELDTPVAEELACAGGLSLLVGFPLLLMLNFPLYGFVAGMPLRYLLIATAIIAVYGLVLFLIWFLGNRFAGSKRKDAQPGADL
jgi:ESS family glutamate:Na+ symporter